MGVSFLTPLDGLFALAAAVPLAALLLVERRSARIRRALSLVVPGRRALAPVALALVLLPALVAVAAAQPVVVRQRLLTQRADAQAFFVLDTSLSMDARSTPTAPTRLERAKREALRLRATLGDLPVGLATMTDRTLPVLLPTTDEALFARALAQSIGIDRPPPSQRYSERATSLETLVRVGDSHFYAPTVRHRILVVFTDGESNPPPAAFSYLARQEDMVPPFLVHVWSGSDRIYVRGGIDPRYAPDPSSAASLDAFAALTRGRVFAEGDVRGVAAAIRAASGRTTSLTTVKAYARVALAPWFVVAGVVPLGFLLYRRNL